MLPRHRTVLGLPLGNCRFVAVLTNIETTLLRTAVVDFVSINLISAQSTLTEVNVTLPRFQLLHFFNHMASSTPQHPSIAAEGTAKP
mmetsp:Transcript_3923/g.7062  ORF Transcript_3923/g.7062 Transcript_3923/m.7062 type:complete len:87 (-) Transcript_3923:13-273(-)